MWWIRNEQNHKELCPKRIYANYTADLKVRKTVKQKPEDHKQNENKWNLNNVGSFHGLEYQRRSVLNLDEFLVCEGNIRKSIEWFLNPIVYDWGKESPFIILKKINLLENNFGYSLVFSFMVLVKFNVIDNIIKTLSRNGTKRVSKRCDTERNDGIWWKGAYSWALLIIIIVAL